MAGGDGLVAKLRQQADDALRVVAEYDRDGYDIRYAREDIGARLDEQAEDIHRNLVLEGISRTHLEDLFDAGDLRCSMHRFDEVTVFHFPDDEYTGLFVSVDSNVDIPLASFTDTCWKSL
ncbi:MULTISPECIES: hypothetical protein [Halobacterium]|uniref:hypothetical protein n=1 Tax=Halobacterium TaxID=2239 RepID=UPI00073F3F60|nr:MULTISPECIES: hypothetical protein [Halobacterium]MCG1002329.1 hypothetical protein [Halobacterium noricense]